ncbi:MAG: polymer-forming cytoskeletal protein [Candidatus Sulfotelmatobacter sp.]
MFTLLLPGAAFAGDDSSYTEFGHSINVGPDQHVSDLTCFGCSIHVRGQVAGDVTAIGGSIILEDQAKVSGDVTAIAGDARLGAGIQVGGDATVIGGELRRDPQASVGGDVTSMFGRGWLFLIFLVPFMILGLVVAFVIWLVQCLRNPSVPAGAA